MGACEACHSSKVKCQYDGKSKNENPGSSVGTIDGPCDRCLRLGIECLPHLSLQGKHSKRMKTRKNGTKSTTPRTMDTERQFVKFSGQLSRNGPLHFGLNHIVRQWFALAFSRGSLRLLEVATRLANRADMKMDQIMHGRGLPVEWFLNPMSRGLTSPMLSSNAGKDSSSTNTERTNVVEDAETMELNIFDVPLEVLHAMRCLGRDPAHCSEKSCPQLEIKERWIFIRETTHHRVRFFLSEAFERDIASLSTVVEAWKENKKEVKQLWMVDNQDSSFAKTFYHFISSYTDPASNPEGVRLNGKQIKLKDGSTTIKADLIMMYRIVDLDRSYMVNEIIPSVAFPRQSGDSIEDSSSDAGSVQMMNSATPDKFEDFPAFEELSGDSVDLSWLEDLLENEVI